MAKDTISVGDLKSKTTQALSRLRKGHKPIIITEGGEPTAVLITLEDFERLHEHDRFVEAVREGLADSEAGRVVDDETFSREIDTELPARP